MKFLIEASQTPLPQHCEKAKLMKVMTILGTRPEIIRLSRVMAKLDELCDHRIVHTGQNYDYELNEVFFSDLAIRKPDYFLGAAGATLGQTLGAILVGAEKVLMDWRPDAVLILGDTNSAISAIMARRLKIPVYHMEAGNRSFDRNVPEELNRKIVDHIADFNLVYTEHGRRHLIAEGLPQRRIYLTGSPMREVLNHYRGEIEASNVLGRLGLEPGKYFIASIHREENVDNSHRLRSIVEGMNRLASDFGYDVIVSVHPRTRNRIDKLSGLAVNSQVRFEKPFGYFDYNLLQMKAFCAISDSGTIAEEASILGFPAITPRDAIERPEGVDTGCIMFTGTNADSIVEGVNAVTKLHALNPTGSFVSPTDYQITNTSDRVVKLILGSARLSNAWDGIRENDLGG